RQIHRTFCTRASETDRLGDRKSDLSRRYCKQIIRTREFLQSCPSTSTGQIAACHIVRPKCIRSDRAGPHEKRRTPATTCMPSRRLQCDRTDVVPKRSEV